jgi:two-component system cell cycle response regulator DivK
VLKWFNLAYLGGATRGQRIADSPWARVAMNPDPKSFPLVSPEASSPYRSFRVLIVDDYDDIRDMMRFMLELQGMKVSEAINGQEAIEVACREHPQLILMDLNMPVMDGLEATQQLKRLDATRRIPVLALSANCSDPHYHFQALDAGCCDCLTKPADWEKILVAIDAFKVNSN